MKYLTQKEILFLEALHKDYEKNGEKSFLEILFLGEISSYSKIKNELDNLFNSYYEKLFKESDLLIESVDCMYIGKYKDTFWGTGSEGEVFGLGKEIQNIAFFILKSYYGNVQDIEEKKDICEYFKNHLSLDYDDYINTYRNFCKNLGYEYKEDLDLISQQSEEFEKMLGDLK
jgi:hypothetical protein